MSKSLGGFLRIGLVHYNTIEEVDRLLAALREIRSVTGAQVRFGV